MSVTRRSVLKGSAAVVAAAAMPGGPLNIMFPAAAGAATLDFATFKKLVGSTFQVAVTGGAVALTLASATQETRPTKKGECFSLLFDGSTRFGQGVYTTTHPSLGSFPLFLVPVNPPGTPTTSYQAIFNRV